MLRYYICADTQYGHSFAVMINREVSVAALENGTRRTGYAMAQLVATLRYKRNVTGFIPHGVIGIFH